MNFSAIGDVIDDLNTVNLTQMELEVVAELTENLWLIEIAALDLGCNGTNLIKADKAFDFLLANMEQNTWIGEQLYVAVKARIQDRRIPYIFLPS